MDADATGVRGGGGAGLASSATFDSCESDRCAEASDGARLADDLLRCGSRSSETRGPADETNSAAWPAQHPSRGTAGSTDLHRFDRVERLGGPDRQCDPDG